MMPHLGVLSTVCPEIALEIFEKDCLVRLGTCIAFSGTTKESQRKAGHITINMPNGDILEDDPLYGSIKMIPLKEAETAEVEIKPARQFDIGAGPGKTLTTTVDGGVVGIMIDARGRPLDLPENDGERRKKLIEWFKALQAYPEDYLNSL